MHTSCTPCALRGHACRLTRLRFVPTRRRLVVARGRRAWRAKVFSRPSPTCTSRSALLYRHAQRAMGQRSVRSGPWSSESVGVGSRGVIFFIKTRVCVHEKGIFFFGSRRTGARKEGFLAGGGARKNAIFCPTAPFSILCVKSWRF